METIPDGSRCFIEVKVGPEAVPALVKAVRASGKRPEQLAVISFHAETLAEAKRRLPELKMYYLSSFRQDKATGDWEPKVEDLIARARAIGADGLDLSYKGPIDRAYVDRVKAAGLATLRLDGRRPRRGAEARRRGRRRDHDQQSRVARIQAPGRTRTSPREWAGKATREADNGNRSKIHRDLVQIQRPDYGGGTIAFDGVPIRVDGRFIPEELQALQPGVSMNTATALNQLLEPLSQSLSLEGAKAIVNLQIDPAIQARIEELADLCNEGQLSDSDRAEYESYVEGAEILALIKLKARRYLANHGAA